MRHWPEKEAIGGIDEDFFVYAGVNSTCITLFAILLALPKAMELYNWSDKGEYGNKYLSF